MFFSRAQKVNLQNVAIRNATFYTARLQAQALSVKNVSVSESGTFWNVLVDDPGGKSRACKILFLLFLFRFYL